MIHCKRTVGYSRSDRHLYVNSRLNPPFCSLDSIKFLNRKIKGAKRTINTCFNHIITRTLTHYEAYKFIVADALTELSDASVEKAYLYERTRAGLVTERKFDSEELLLVVGFDVEFVEALSTELEFAEVCLSSLLTESELCTISLESNF